MAAAYVKYAVNLGLRSDILLSENGHMILKFSGVNVFNAFKNEGGKHCIQRVPATERGGRAHTSMVSVMVLPLPVVHAKSLLPDNEIETITQRGSGAGGQNQNKVSSAVRMKHPKTGLSVFINGRDQNQNKKEALRILSARVQEFKQQQTDKTYGDIRKQQWGGGGRGDKIRTYNLGKNPRVVDHRTGAKTHQVEAVLYKGRFDLLLKQV